MYKNNPTESDSSLKPDFPSPFLTPSHISRQNVINHNIAVFLRYLSKSLIN